MKASKFAFATVRHTRCLLGTMFALVVADGLITNFLMAHGLGREWNPFLQTLAGGELFLLIKIGGAFLSALILWDIYKRRPQVAAISSLCIVVVYTGIVYWNLFTVFISWV